MKYFFKKINTLLIITSFVLNLFPVNLTFADENKDLTSKSSEENDKKIQDFIQKQAFAIQKLKEAISRNKSELKIKNELMNESNEKVDELEVKIDEVTDIISYYDQEITTKEQILLSLSKQVIEKESESLILNEEISIKEKEIENQKNFMSDLLEIIYASYDVQKDPITFVKSPVKVFLSNKSMSELDQNIEYLSVFHQTSQDIFKKLESNKEYLDELKQKLNEKKEEIEKAKKTSEDEQKELETIKALKEKTLNDLKNEKNIFIERMSFAKKQEKQIIKETDVLFRTIEMLNGDLEKVKETGDIDIALALDIRNKLSISDLDVSTDLMWPASPFRGITTIFNDPTYPFKGAIGNHKAIDVRMPQGTALFAPLNGIVTYANGYGINDESDSMYFAYHKVVITDETGRSITLGHVSETFVKKGDIVMQGDLVALSGALPGTKGAGAYTTGAHLHFELHMPEYDLATGNKKIIAVDPLLYFSLDEVPLDSLGESYLETLLDKRDNIYEKDIYKTYLNFED